MNTHVWVIVDKTSQYAREQWTEPEPVALGYQYLDPAVAWRRRLADASSCGLTPDPNNFVIVMMRATGEKDERGVDLFVPDWTTAIGADSVRGGR